MRLPFIVDHDDRDRLTEGTVTAFQTILGVYFDFVQREKFAKLKKLRKSQANLPMAEYRTNLIETLKNNQVVIVAGDTGCGKSTQVRDNSLKLLFWSYIYHKYFVALKGTRISSPRCNVAPDSFENRVSIGSSL